MTPQSAKQFVPDAALQARMQTRLAESDLDATDGAANSLTPVDGNLAGAMDFYPACAGIVIPYFDPLNDGVLETRRIRYFDAPMIDGKSRRYSQPKGSPVEAYFPRDNDWKRIFHNPKIELHITEGEFKSLCLNKHGFTSIALGGVDSFGGPELLPSLQKIAWKGRRVNIAFDSDIILKSGVQSAENKLAAALHTKGALVYILRLPEVNG